MKSFTDNAFLLLFEEILRRDKPKDAPDRWSVSGVTWQHARHGYESSNYGFAVDTFEVVNAAKGWALLVVKDQWWAGRNGGIIRTVHWAKPMRGSRAAIMAWLKSRQREIEGRL